MVPGYGHRGGVFLQALKGLGDKRRRLGNRLRHLVGIGIALQIGKGGCPDQLPDFPGNNSFHDQSLSAGGSEKVPGVRGTLPQEPPMPAIRRHKSGPRNWPLIAYAARYGRQPLSEILRLSKPDLQAFTRAISDIIEAENGPYLPELTPEQIEAGKARLATFRRKVREEREANARRLAAQTGTPAAEPLPSSHPTVDPSSPVPPVRPENPS